MSTVAAEQTFGHVILAICAGRVAMRENWGKIIASLEERSRWAELRELGNSGIVKSSILMPVFGYMLLLNEKVHQYLTVMFDHPWLPATWRIWMVFYGTFAIAIGSALYSWRAPEKIKRYGSPVDMIATEPSYHWPAGNYKRLRHHVEKLRDELPGWQKSLPQLRDYKDHSGTPNTEPEARDWLTEFISQWWEIENLRWRAVRIIIFVLFRIGFVLVIIPSAYTFIQVTVVGVKYLIGSLPIIRLW